MMLCWWWCSTYVEQATLFFPKSIQQCIPPTICSNSFQMAERKTFHSVFVGCRRCYGYEISRFPIKTELWLRDITLWYKDWIQHTLARESRKCLVFNQKFLQQQDRNENLRTKCFNPFETTDLAFIHNLISWSYLFKCREQLKKYCFDINKNYCFSEINSGNKALLWMWTTDFAIFHLSVWKIRGGI